MKTITKEYLRSHPDEIFVFGDNLQGRGYGGAAALRDEPNTYSFITKLYPTNDDDAFYRPGRGSAGYDDIFKLEIHILEKMVSKMKDKTFLISQLGAGLANKYHIWEKVIEPGLKVLEQYPNVRFLWKEKEE